MKTNQVITRKIGELDVFQRTSDGYFDGSSLLLQWNATKGNQQKQMNEFMSNKNTNDFIIALSEEISLSGIPQQIDTLPFMKVKTRTHRVGRPLEQTFMHPYLFIKFAMWINPRFEVKVIKFVYDELIKYRCDAGDYYVKMCSAISKLVSKKNEKNCIQEVAKALNHIVFNAHEKGARNNLANESSMKELYELEFRISQLINDGFITGYDQLITYLRKLWVEKYHPVLPKCFNVV